MLSSHVLALVGVPPKRIANLVQTARSERYASLRGYFHGTSDEEGDTGLRLRLHAVRLPDGIEAIGKQLDSIDLAAFGAEAVLVRRGKKRMGGQRSVVLRPGDVLVLRGTANSIADAEMHLLK